MKSLQAIMVYTLCCIITINLSAQTEFTSKIAPLKGEKWWGGFVALGSKMPFDSNTQVFNLERENYNNQNVPFLLSSKGRYVWCEHPFSFKFNNDTLEIYSNFEKTEAITTGGTIKEAYLAAAHKHFPATNTIPEEIFFSRPQYNTWIELMYNQNQKDILNYANNILNHNLPTGILMIDDNWQRYYGNFDFKNEKFEDAKAMSDTLHRLGFKVMLWICPFVSPDSPEFRKMQAKGYLVKNKDNNEPAMVNWWNGYSACLDTTNPKAIEWFKNLLVETQKKYGIDGFKFDGGDVSYMKDEYIFYDKTANINIFAQRWAEMGLNFPFNEIRTTWKTGGQPLVQRLGDKVYSWNSCELLIGDMTTAGLLGFPYTCPDMIGGGSFSSFLNIKDNEFDQELIVRSCQIHSLMPMMQFSVAPWRILSPENLEICVKYSKLHKQMGDYILSCARHSAKTNEPIVRSMEYAYPHQGFIDCKDQYMLGDKYLVAPMITKGYKRSVYLPRGKWKDDKGKVFRGPQIIKVDVPIDRLPYYEKIK